MSSAGVMPKTGEKAEDALSASRAEAVALLEEVLGVIPRNRYEEVDRAERAIVRLRDGLIERLRREEDVGQVTRLHKALDQANIAISLITGVEYPGAGIQEESLQQAREVLQRLSDDGIL
jgi:hypothetical protein